jgi:hypothetical protein
MRRLIVCMASLVGLLAMTPLTYAQGGGSLEQLTGETESPLLITGFGVADARADGRTGDNSFNAGKLAVSVFRELSEHTWVFGQLTTSVASGAEGDAPADEVTTEIEIDNLIVNFTPPDWSAFSVAVGKFDTPLGFERDDEPLNLQATTSLNFELARPPKMVGVIGRWTSRSVEAAAWVANGWQSDLEPNHGKTIGGRFGVRPSERTSFGVGGLWGPEGEQGETRNRYLVSADYAVQPTDPWIIAGEANAGGDAASNGEEAARWYGGTATVFRRLGRNFGATGRVEAFKDRDGARTGLAQTLTSFTIAPVYFIGVGGEGIFATVEHTTFRIPRFQLRGEIRFDHSNVDAFESSDGETNWTVNYIAQLVTTF